MCILISLCCFAGKCELYACEALLKSCEIAEKNFLNNGYSVFLKKSNNFLQSKAQKTLPADFSSSSNNIVSLIAKHSYEVSLADLKNPFLSTLDAPPKPASAAQKIHLCVSELLDSELIGEGVMPSLRIAHQTILAEDAIVVPCSAVLKGQLVEIRSELLLEAYFKAPKVDLDGNLGSDFLPCKGYHSAINLHAERLIDSSHMRLLSDEFNVFDFDWTQTFGMKTCPEMSQFSTCAIKDLKRSQSFPVKITQSGTLHGLLIYWEADLNQNHRIHTLKSYCKSCRSGAEICEPDCCWRDHWMPNLYLLSAFDGFQAQFGGGDVRGAPGKGVETGQEVWLKASHDDFCVWFEYETKISAPSVWEIHFFAASKQEKSAKILEKVSFPKGFQVDKYFCECGIEKFSPKRKVMIFDPNRRKYFVQEISTLFKDFSAKMAANHSTSGKIMHIFLMDGSCFLSSLIFQIFSTMRENIFLHILSSNETDFFTAARNVKIYKNFQEFCAEMSSNFISLSCLLCEPFFSEIQDFEGPLNDSLQIVEYFSALEKRFQIFSSLQNTRTLFIYPFGFTLKAAPIQFRHLWKNHRKVPNFVESVDISSINQFKDAANYRIHPSTPHQPLYSSTSNLVSYPLWEYDYRMIGSSQEVLQASFRDIATSAKPAIHASNNFQLDGDFSVDGFVLWVEYFGEGRFENRTGSEWMETLRG
eukprot:Sdes_comp20695_c0_seq2m16278